MMYRSETGVPFPPMEMSEAAIACLRRLHHEAGERIKDLINNGTETEDTHAALLARYFTHRLLVAKQTTMANFSPKRAISKYWWRKSHAQFFAGNGLGTYPLIDEHSPWHGWAINHIANTTFLFKMRIPEGVTMTFDEPSITDGHVQALVDRELLFKDGIESKVDAVYCFGWKSPSHRDIRALVRPLLAFQERVVTVLLERADEAFSFDDMKRVLQEAYELTGYREALEQYKKRAAPLEQQVDARERENLRRRREWPEKKRQQERYRQRIEDTKKRLGDALTLFEKGQWSQVTDDVPAPQKNQYVLMFEPPSQHIYQYAFVDEATWSQCGELFSPELYDDLMALGVRGLRKRTLGEESVPPPWRSAWNEGRVAACVRVIEWER